MAIGLGKSGERRSREVALQRKDVMRVRSRRGLAVVCLEGAVWVTQAGNAEDHVLWAGEQMSVKRQGRIVVEAVRDARVQVQE